MANLNSENPRVGRKFQEFVQTILKEKYNTYFEQEAAIPIGRPPKEHKFDLANADRSIVAECKCYTWTDSGNVPSAKLMGLDEAVIRCSICTGEQVAGFRSREDGSFVGVMVIQSEKDLENFKRLYRVDDVKKIY